MKSKRLLSSFAALALLALPAAALAQSEATLSDLVPSAGTLAPTFASGTFSYTASVPYTTTSMTVTPTATDINATITVDGSVVASGSASGPISLSVGANVITNVVVSADKTATNTYTLTVTRAAAVVGTWSNVGGGTWSTPGNWVGSTIADGVGATANLTANFSGNRNVTIDGAVSSRTLGILNIGDSGSTYYVCTVNATGSGLLTFDNLGATAQINQTSTGFNDVLNNTLGIQLNDSLAISNNATINAPSISLTIAGTISSTAAGTKTISNVGIGSGLVTLSGVISEGTGTVAIHQNSATSPMLLSGNNSYNGANTVSAGTLSLSGANTGVGATTVNGGTMTFLKRASLYYDVPTSWIPANITVASGGTLGLGVGANGSGYFDVTDIDTFLASMGTSDASTGLKPGAKLGFDTSAGDLIYSSNLGDLSGGHVLNVAKLGNNKLTLSGANTYTGTTTANAGVLVPLNVAALPGYNVPGKVIFIGGTISASDVGGAAGWTTTEVDALLANAIKTSGALGIDTDIGDLTQWAAFTAATFGPLGLNKVGLNTLTLDKVNAYTGPTIVTSGTLKLSNADAISASSGLFVSGGSVVLDTAVNLKALTFNVAANSSVTGGTLNFSSGGSINQYFNNYDATITSQITGSPTINVNRGPTGNQYKGLIFAPDTGTQTLGVITLPAALGGINDKAGVTLGGTTTGNTVTSIGFTNSSWGYSTVNKTDSSTWTVGNIDTGTININGGTLVINGTAKVYYTTLTVNTGGRMSGNWNVLMNDRRQGASILTGGTMAPGNGVGTVSFAFNPAGGNLTNAKYGWRFQTGSIYEWEVGATTNDIVHIVNGTGGTGTQAATLPAGLTVEEGMILKILDAGGRPVATDRLPVFTYAPGVTVSIGTVTFDTSALGADWGFGSLSLVDDGAGTIYLTGLSKLSITSSGPLTGRSFPLTFSGTSGQSYEVLTSTNVELPMASWTVLGIGTFGASPVTYTDTSATNAQQFYRIKSPLP